MKLKNQINTILEERKKMLDSEINTICERIIKIYAAFPCVATIKISCNKETRELTFKTVNYNIVSMKKEDWQLAYDVYFAQPSVGVDFYTALRTEIHERVGIAAELIYSENEELPEIIGLNVSISNLIIKK